MLSLEDPHARLALEKDEPFTSVTASVRSLFQVCRLTRLPGALIVSEQLGFDFRSSMRVALKFAAIRPAPLPGIRLALVAGAADEGMLQRWSTLRKSAWSAWPFATRRAPPPG